jgi:hypothetical protein
MKHRTWILALLLLLPLWGCGDDVCETFDSPTSQACEVNADCSEVSCGSVCSDSFSDARGSAFCENSLCFCPCEVCVRVD